ncbi:MAG TPA: tetratricopeptide repeat protein, partial [Ktedonobacteraceae bacterium]
MTKATRAALIWSHEQQGYLWHDTKRTEATILHEEAETWLQWLAGHTSFSFQGREGSLTLLKETRPRGEDGYWYAYRRRGKRTLKKYVGRTTDLTFARLERTACALLYSPEKTGQGQHALLPDDPCKESEGPDWQVTDLLQQQQQDLSSSLQNALLLPKFLLPSLHSSLVLRERLLALLDRGLEHRLTLVSAPAGFGKTTLVRQWVAKRSKLQHFPPLAWVSLDAGDNDPARFWRYLMTACQTFQEDLAREALNLLQASSQPPFEASLIETALTTFLNALAEHEQRGIICLDDYHVITSPRVQELMTFFLDHLPADIHVIIITRSDPPIPLARLRIRNALYEMRAFDLRFSQEETSAFLQQTLVTPCAPEIILRINTHLEGWAAGLRLLLVALRERTLPAEIEPFLRTFASSQYGLQEYFLEEILNTQPEPLQRFLLQTSVLGRLTGSLCDSITGTRDSTRFLERLAHANLFLEPLDKTTLHLPQVSRPWYRYHGLFAEAMQQEARRRLGEETLRAISFQACHWYEAHGLYAEAVETALQAQDHAHATALIERILEAPDSYQQASEYHTLYNWLEQIPEEMLQQHPLLCLSYARALLSIVVTWRLAPQTLAQLEKCLQMAEQSFRTKHNLPKLGEVFAFRSLVAWRQEEATHAASYARQALLWLSKEQMAWRGLSLSVTGKAELLYNGRVNIARGMLEEAYALCEMINNQYFKHATTNMLANTFFEQGELHSAAEYYQRALSKAREYSHSDDVGHALFGLARISYERNELATARQQAEEVLAIGQYLVHELHEVRATLLLARIQHVRGETTAARQRLATLLAKLPTPQSEHTTVLFREILTLQARLALATDDLAFVQRWQASPAQASKPLPPFSSEREALVLARWHLAQGRAKEAHEDLQVLLREALEAGRNQSALEIQALMVQALAWRNQKAEALQMLQTLLR